LREAQVAAALRSPHVVQVLDHGIDEATRAPFIVMELLEGESLAARLRRLGRLPPAEVFTIVKQLGRALSYAHESGIVHRDLKPDNIHLVPNRDEVVVKVLDFGVARGFERLDTAALTAEGRTVGTPFYMSPEQLRGETLDYRLDLWSLATIACECLTGKRPFHARDVAALAALLCGSEPRPVPSALGPVPVGFDTWFVRATARNIEARFQSAEQLVDHLRPICLPEGHELAPERSQRHPLESAPLDAPTASVDAPTMAALSRTQDSVVPRFLRGRRLVAGIAAGLVLGALGIRFWRSPVPPPSALNPARTDSAALTPAAASIQSLRPPDVPTVREPRPPEPSLPPSLPPSEPEAAPPLASAVPSTSAPETTQIPTKQRPRRPSSQLHRKMESKAKEADSQAVSVDGRFIRGDL
jgi:serine/threonine-protein kinase